MHSIFIIRHGETKSFTENLYQGESDASLTKKGRESAKKIAQALKGKDIKYIYSSPLRRTQETSKIIAETISAEIILIPEFKEMSFGVLEGKDVEAVKQEYKELFIRRTEDVIYKISTPLPQGESYLDLHKRIKSIVPALIKIREDFVIVGHQSINRVIRAIILDIPLEFAVTWRQKNYEFFEINSQTKKEFKHSI